MSAVIRRLVLSVAMVTFLAAVSACNSTANDPTVPGGGSSTGPSGPKNMQEWYNQNQPKKPAPKGSVK